MILDAALKAGIEIPHYCYHPALSVAGSCRMCLVEVEGMPKLQTACSTPVGEQSPEKKVDGRFDMVVHTRTEKVLAARKLVLEFLLINHPLDCPVCDQAGECFLQAVSAGGVVVDGHPLRRGQRRRLYHRSEINLGGVILVYRLYVGGPRRGV